MHILNQKPIIYLDTNVIINGALSSSGPSRQLNSIASTVQFVYSDHVLQECKSLIAKNSSSSSALISAMCKVFDFLKELSANVVQDKHPPNDLRAQHLQDTAVLGAAYWAHADAICTYNIADFPRTPITPCTPLTLLRRHSPPSLTQYIQPITLGEEGTLLFFGSIHHPSSMGAIIRSDNGTEVFADEQGYIRLSGANTARQSNTTPLRANEEFKLVIRYNTSEFRAMIWRREEDYWVTSNLTTGRAAFSYNTIPLLFFAPNHRFSGHVQSISGVSRFVKDRSLKVALDNYSLEAVYGSTDIRQLVR